ncbi:unnamed protein product [Adineta steineri]|uniref:Sulfotransferase n=1 Tax=Adineta steineri TaxID=433720 RepID=A0A814IN83_9BILA|nr:unnamed protein product [Adineta steineri]CAF3728379.1 unnamed protein product [Adineta steineri]
MNEESKLALDFHLNEDELTNEAKRLFPFYTEIIKSLNYNAERILNNTFIPIKQKYIICSKLSRSYNNVKNVLNYLSTKPLKTKQKVNEFPMIVICGLARTGTTLLHNLMACDPSCRAPLITDMIHETIPPISRSNTDEHRRRAKLIEDAETEAYATAKHDLKKFLKNFSASHALFPHEEDSVLLEEAGVKISNVISAFKDTDFTEWLINQKNKDFCYQYHQTVLQMLHDVDPPRTHWQLKTPQHTLWMDTLLKYYPQASIIMSHRRLDQVIPSIHRLGFSSFAHFYDEEDSTNLKLNLEEILSTINDAFIHRLIEFHRHQSSTKHIFDIQYEDLMKDPIGTVRHIYDHFDFLEWSDEFEEKMRAWLIENPQGKQGRNSYSLSEFHLETQMDKQIYKDYEKMFLRDNN